MLQAVSLDDKYALERGRAFMSGVQALVRLPLLQRARDRAAGLSTAGFISGYRGSPLGTYDDALTKAARFLEAADVRFHPGLNEDLAATSLWGTQQVALLPTRTVEGVFGIWYGKGPGVDRTADVFKHANAAGTSSLGGVLAVMGDDHGCQSSTLPHQSEQIMAAAMIPVLNPANVQDHLDLGLLGFALSRYSGCWVGLKATTEVIEASAVVDIDPMRLQIVTPLDFTPPDGGLAIRWPDTPLEQERRLHGAKMAAVLAFARANGIDRTIWRPANARLGIVAAGKAYADVRQALDDLGVGEREAAALGLALYKVGMSWPLEPAGAARFAAGLDEILVV
ncbi:MAG: indolepyruvate ferredoxin oxidoreductase, partial [Phenylobacterium sp.]|nr:indolepyruvate ferredoxin oxidoreductase [Phenylobacterium sp.]